MLTINAVAALLQKLAPLELAEDWDNVGLLVGDPDREVRRVMTCLTITPATAAEAAERKAQLIVTHHPMPFRPLRRVTTETTPGRLLLELIAAGIGVYSAHTAMDSAREGINARLATGLGLRGITPLVPRDGGLGTGRWGWLEEPLSLGRLADRAKKFLAIGRMQMVGEPDQPVRTVAVACGAAGELLDAARQVGCDSMLIGETRLHTTLEAEATGIGLLLAGHFASERFAVELLAERLGAEFPELDVWASRTECDPIRWV